MLEVDLSLFPPLHDLCAHFYEAGFGFAVWEAGNRLDGFVDVFLGKCAGLL